MFTPYCLARGVAVWGPPTFDVQITIFDLSRNAVKQVTLENQPLGDGSWQWDGTDNQGQALAAGIYTYRLVATHAAHSDICWDQDKSYQVAMQPPFDFKLLPTVLKFYYWEIDEQAETMTGCVKYNLNHDAGACQVKLYSLTPTGGGPNLLTSLKGREGGADADVVQSMDTPAVGLCSGHRIHNSGVSSH